jgi:hypothetical protein
LLGGRISVLPHCGTWISAEDWGEEEKESNYYEQFHGINSGARLVIVGIKIVKTGASLIGGSVLRNIGSSSR